ncbi:hypothetical protein Tco_0909334 [Tanacetum coccineum]|uniref:Uncharacterized protein n=1 Tax=Tanacetum coccineum TaxID=301880 RepID=A0ABQ5CQQ2_9ASTR
MGVSISSHLTEPSMLLNGVWRFHSQGFSLWSRVIKAIHGVDGMSQGRLILEVTRCSQMANIDIYLLEGICLPNMLDRWCWSLSGDEEFSVSSARILIDDKTLGTVGSKTHCGERLANVFPRLYALEQRKDCSITARWILSNNVWGGNWEWRIPPRGRAMDDLSDMLNLISNLELSSSGLDKWVWVCDVGLW